MIQMLRKRLDRKDEGFTLIELMVVVLIIAILLAIAIPTFLGARSRAQNRSAESNLRNALTAEKTAFTDNSSYVAASAVQTVEPSLSFVAAGTLPTKGSNQVETSALETGNAVCLIAQSASGAYFGIYDETAASGGLVTAGTWYASWASSATPGCATVADWHNTTSGASW